MASRKTPWVPARKMSSEYRRLALSILEYGGAEAAEAARETSSPRKAVTPQLSPVTAAKVRNDLAKLRERGKPQSQAFAQRMLTLYPSLQGATE